MKPKALMIITLPLMRRSSRGTNGRCDLGGVCSMISLEEHLSARTFVLGYIANDLKSISFRKYL